MNSNKNWLILVPTKMELSRLDFGSVAADAEISGFGPVVSAARTAALVSDLKPARILLAGIAGTYLQDLKIGSAFQFRRTQCHGIGIGQGEKHIGAADAGWSQFDAEPRIGDILELSVDEALARTIANGNLQTVCAASGDLAEANRNKLKNPNCVAEDMEGFAVAAAASFFRIPVYVVRGISNRAGDRDHQNWAIDQALNAVNELALFIIRNNP